MLLRELMEKPVKYYWARKGGQTTYALFVIDGEEYIVNFDTDFIKELDDDATTIDFSSEDGGFDITGKGNQIKVFSTVFNIIKEFLQKFKPNHVAFSAKEPSRRKLYQHFIKRYAPKLGYQLGHQEKFGKIEAYFLVRM